MRNSNPTPKESDITLRNEIKFLLWAIVVSFLMVAKKVSVAASFVVAKQPQFTMFPGKD